MPAGAGLREARPRPPTLADDVRRNWLAQRGADDGCTLAASRLIGERHRAATA
jgi:soluble lytic murein transglycosylase